VSSQYLNFPIPEESVLRYLPGLMGWKDPNSRFLATNQVSARLFGFNTIEEIVGLSDAEVKCGVAECAQTFVMHDKKVLAGQTLTVLNIHPYANRQINTFVTSNLPLRDAQGSIVGIFFYSVQLDNVQLQKLFFQLSSYDAKKFMAGKSVQGSYVVGMPKDISLTRRESECLFYLIRGKTAKSIGMLLGLEKRTIEDYVDRIKVKLGVTSKEALIEFAFNHGLVSAIPDSFLPKNLSLILHEADENKA